ncbi:pertactin-like passenger domain-containing protein [Orbus hercynius]|uniref:pertactin-like passenger domain-containing protein n=1 Tax=Orbus hercynius TaxID=593135 RepID=UPI000EB092D3|nr:pertactin-like passenger domain-containing protein [Orbus hercynius]
MKKSKKNRIAICICAVTFTTFLNAIKVSADTNDGIYHISSDLQNVTFETIEDSNGMSIMVDPNVKVTNVNFLCGAHINGGISINSLYSSSFISDAGTLNGNTFINALVTFHDDTKGSDNTFKDTEIAQAYNTSLENTVLINSSLHAQRNTSMMGETFVTSNSQLGLSGVTLENLTVDSTSSVFASFSGESDINISKIVNDGYFNIYVSRPDLRSHIINIGDYSGSGIIHMYINLADNQAADLTINQTAAGVKNLVNIKNDGSKDANENSRVNLIKVNSKDLFFR